MRYLGLLFILFCSCSVQSTTGYTSLPPEKKKHFIPYNPETINDSVDYFSNDFTVQEITSEQVKDLAERFQYTWVVIWAPWCPGPETGELAKKYLEYEKSLKGKGVKLIFVAIGYGPEGIRKMARQLNYHKITFVITDHPGVDNLKEFHKKLNNKRAYRNSIHYIFQKGKGLIYTGKEPEMKKDKLEAVITQTQES